MHTTIFTSQLFFFRLLAYIFLSVIVQKDHKFKPAENGQVFIGPWNIRYNFMVGYSSFPVGGASNVYPQLAVWYIVINSANKLCLCMLTAADIVQQSAFVQG